MKKKIMMIIIAMVAVAGITAGAFKVAEVIEEETAYEETTEVLTEEDAERLEKITAFMEEAGYTDTEDKFSAMLMALDATVENPIEYNTILYNLEYIKRVYNISDEQMDYIYELISSGLCAEDVIEISYFWTDTNEDISIIKEVYDIKDRYRSDAWIENAFNYVTGDKCGVLTTEDVHEYLGKGLSVADITTANKMCRKAVLTIQEILEMRLDGTSFAEISAIIDGTSTAEISAMTAVPFSVSQEPAAEPISGQAVTTVNEIAEIEDKSVTEYYERILSGESADEILLEAEEKIDKEITTELKESGLYKDFSETEFEEYIAKREEEQK